jgi:amidase
MTDSDDFAWLDATAQAELVAKGKASPEELLDAALARAERLNPELNAIIRPMEAEARAAIKAGLPDGPLKGVPFLLKDLAAEYAGVAMSEGSRFLGEHNVANEDQELTRRFKSAGLVIFGKTNTPEFGLLPTTEPELFGPTHNPWDPTRTPGGSSGGSAAAVASGLVPAAHANDGGGSIRIPASCCGVFGLKPSRGRNSLAPHYGDVASGIVAEHVVTRSVRDSAALLDATAGPATGDPYWAPPPERPFAQEVGADPGALRIALSTKPINGVPVDPDCVAAAEDAAALCAELGHHVEEATPDFDPALGETFSQVWVGFLGWAVDDWSRRMGRTPREGDFEPWTARMLEVSREQSTADYLLAVQDVQAAGRTLARFLQTYDLMLTPTVASPPMPLGSFDYVDGNRARARESVFALAAFTPLCNVAGNPAMSVPLFWTAAGLPVGAHFIGRAADEATLFRIAAQLEEARPWADKRPPVSA